jgi:hypothetical protein
MLSADEALLIYEELINEAFTAGCIHLLWWLGPFAAWNLFLKFASPSVDGGKSEDDV